MGDTNGARSEPQTREERVKFLTSSLKMQIAECEAFPPYVNIETHNMCNARCVMCGIDFDKRTKVRMSEELFSKIVDELSRWRTHVRKVNLYFDNEPLLDRDLAAKIARLKQAGVPTVAIATNASALIDVRATELLAAGLDQIYITIDSMTPQVYEKIRVGLSFHKVYNNTLNFIRRRNEINPKTMVRLQMVMQEDNRLEATSFVDHWVDKLAPGDIVAVHRAHNWGGVTETLHYDGDEQVNAYPCPILWSNAMIHADGQMALCSVDTEQISPHTLGDVNANSIESIWQGDRLRHMRERHLEGKRQGHPLCDGCTTWRELRNEMYVEIPRS